MASHLSSDQCLIQNCVNYYCSKVQIGFVSVNSRINIVILCIQLRSNVVQLYRRIKKYNDYRKLITRPCISTLNDFYVKTVVNNN